MLQKFIDAGLDLIVIGGYGVSAYKHRFSIDADLVISEERKLNFFKYISRYCKSWEKEYSHNIVYDGTCWECDIWIDDFRLKSNGLEEYPTNFKAFLKKLSILTSGKIFE